MTTEQKHTPTPSKRWVVGFDDGSGTGEDGEGCYITMGYADDGRTQMAVCSGGKDDWGCAVGFQDKSYAYRAVACYNACLDMPDPATEIARLRSDSLALAFSHAALVRAEAERDRLSNENRQYLARIQEQNGILLRNADERDRLREVNAEMLEAIQWALDDAINGQISYVGKNKLRALIAKHSADKQELKA